MPRLSLLQKDFMTRQGINTTWKLAFSLYSDERIDKLKHFWRILSFLIPPPTHTHLVTDALNPRPRWIGLSRCASWSCTDDTELERVTADSALATVCWQRVKWRANTWESWPLHDGGGAGGEPGHLELGGSCTIKHLASYSLCDQTSVRLLPSVNVTQWRSLVSKGRGCAHAHGGRYSITCVPGHPSDHLCSQQHHKHKRSFVLLRAPWPIDFFCRSSNALFT